MSWPVGTTKRSTSDEPLRHAFTWRHASRWGMNKLALCGASILPYPGGQLAWDQPRDYVAARFDPDHPRACPRCAREAAVRLEES